jgi:hypothetical protein
MNMANINKIKYVSGNTIHNGAITNNNVALGVDMDVDYGPTTGDTATGFYQGVTPNNGGYTIYRLSDNDIPRIVVAQDDEALIFFANSFGDRSDITTVTDAILYFKDNLGYFITNRKFDSITTSGMTLMYDPGLVQSYPKSGTTVSNLGSLGEGNNGPSLTLTSNGADVGFVNEKGGTLRFYNLNDGDGSYATAEYTGSPNDFTYNAWFKAISFDTPTWNFIVGRDGTYQQIGIYEGGFINFFSQPDNIDINDESGNPQIIIGKWHNVTVRHIEGETTQLYVDNVLIGEDTTNTTISNESMTKFFVGGTDGNGMGAYFDGEIGHVAFYDRALSVAEIEKNYNALRSRYYGAATGQTGFFMSAISGGTTYAYVILDPATGTVSSPIDTGISFNDYSEDDIKPLNHSGYGLYFQNRNNYDERIVQFVDAFGTLIETYSGTTSNFDSDDFEGKVLWAHFHDLGVLKYFDGISVGTYTYNTDDESVDVEDEDDGTSRDGSFIIRSMSGSTYAHKILNASRPGAISLPSYNNNDYSLNVRLYDSGDYVAIDTYDSNDGIYTSFDMFDLLGNVISTNDISSFNYNSRSTDHFGTNKFTIIFSNDNDQNQDYKIFAYNGTSVITTTHERGDDFANWNSYSQHYDNPNQDNLSETFTYMFYPNSTGNDGPFSTTDYLNLLSICNGTTGFTTNSIATGTTISFHWNPDGAHYNDMVVRPDGKLYAMFVLPSGVTYTELVADASTLTGLNKWNAGNYVVYETQVDNIHPTFHLVNGTTGALLDQLTFTPAGGYSWSTNNSYTAFMITDYDNSVGWYLNTSTNEFTQFSGQYNNRWEPPTFFRGNDVFTDHPSLLMFNSNDGSARILSTTGLSNEFTLPTSSNGSYDLYRGNSFISYFYKSADNDQPYVRLIDFSGNTLNEFTDADDVNWNFWTSDHNNDVVMVVSGEGLTSGTLRVNLINPDGTTDQQVMSYGNIQNYWREFNDWHWWD